MRLICFWNGHVPGYCNHRECHGNCRCARCGKRMWRLMRRAF
jgi:hypothetical protein